MDTRDGETPVTPEETARRIKDAAGGAVKDVKNAAMQSAEDARAKAGDMGHTTASRLRDLAGQVEGDLPWLSGAFHKSAQGLDSMTNSLTRGDMSQCVTGLSDFARRQPAIFLGASVALGFALARVGKTAMEGVSEGTQTGMQTGTQPAPQPFPNADSGYGPTGP
jgi:hypothetical protein